MKDILPYQYNFFRMVLPHHESRTRALLLSKSILALYCLGIFLLLVATHTLLVYKPGVLGYASNINVSVLLSETNKIRAEQGLTPLILNSSLSDAARHKAEDMFANDYWAHISPQGKKPWDFILGQGYDYEFAGENLAKNFSTSNEVVDAWYASPSHRDNLLNPNYKEIGFAVVNGTLNGYSTTLVVQMFGSQRGVLTGDTPSNDVIETSPVPVVTTEPILFEPLRELSFDPAIDVSSVARTVYTVFFTFFITLLLVDIWYSRRKGVMKVTGHTTLHLIFFFFSLLAVSFVLVPGKIL